MNCDGAFKMGQENDKDNKAGIGVVVRDETGKVIVGVARKVIIRSSIEAEAATLREGAWLPDAMKM